MKELEAFARKHNMDVKVSYCPAFGWQINLIPKDASAPLDFGSFGSEFTLAEVAASVLAKARAAYPLKGKKEKRK